MRDPRPEELELPEFEKVWQAIKGWSIERSPGDGHSDPTGTDVITILDALGITKPQSLRVGRKEKKSSKIPKSLIGTNEW